MSNASASHPVLVSAVRHGLRLPSRRTSLDAESVRQVLHQARFDHTTGFLVRAVAEGEVSVNDSAVRDKLTRQWHEELRTSVLLEAMAVRLAGTLDGIEWRLTKGAALAHLDYGDPSLRTFGDIDLVIHPRDWTATRSRLAAAGYERATPPLTVGYDHRWGKGATFISEDRMEVDLHRRFAVGRFGVTARMEDVFGAHDEIILAGRPIRVMDPTCRLLHACYHATLGGFRRLRAFRDVAQLLLVTGADWHEAFAIARTWRGEAVVAAAIETTWHRLDIKLDHPAYDAARNTRIGWGDRRALEVFRQERRFRSQALTTIGRLPLRDTPGFLWSLSRSRLRRDSR